MQFKLIAIKPLESCDQQHLKILKPNVVYYFLNDYKITADSISHRPTIDKDFFKIGQTNFSVNAIVGKNGSGKSSLVELLIYAINNLSKYYDFNPEQGFKFLPNLDVELYFHTNAYYKIALSNSIVVYKQNANSGQFKKIQFHDFEFGSFFYSIIVNYSHYGLNSREMGSWIDSLFHKNDGYQTPIVINPFRTEGNININIENSLAKARLVANILSNTGNSQEFKITNNSSAWEIILTRKSSSDEVLYRFQDIDENSKTYVRDVRIDDLRNRHSFLLRKLNEHFDFGYNEKSATESYLTKSAHKYLIRKLVKIATTYSFYGAYFDMQKRRFNGKKLDKFLDLILDKNANHISFKLKQTLNFLKYRHIDDEYSVNLNIESFSEKVSGIIKNNQLNTDDLITLIPPPIFHVDIVLKSRTNSSLTTFSTLSSGEKQLIYSVNSILYHLLNLDSIKHSDLQRNYECVNVILEEIELYFHPNMQKEFLKFLLYRINEIRFKNIKSIGLCFVTHSPFILSDIPNANILFLDEDGLPRTDLIDIKTFGANIHDLLKHSFFLKSGSVGDYARDKINDTIKYLNYRSLKKRLAGLPPNDRATNSIRQETLILEKEISEFDEKKHKELIRIIGEPILQRKLSQMFDEVTNENLELSIIQKQIDELRAAELKLTYK